MKKTIPLLLLLVSNARIKINTKIESSLKYATHRFNL